MGKAEWGSNAIPRVKIQTEIEREKDIKKDRNNLPNLPEKTAKSDAPKTA